MSAVPKLRPSGVAHWRAVACAAVVIAAVTLILPAAAGAQATDPAPSSTPAAASTPFVQGAKKITLPSRRASVSGPTDVAATTDAVWVLAPAAGAVYRIDPATNRVKAQVKLPAPGCQYRCEGIDRIAATTRDVWVVNSEVGSLVHIDARRNKVAGTFPMTPGSIGPVVPDADGVWLAPDPLGSTVVYVDARTDTATKTVDVGVGPAFPVALVDRMLWVGNAPMYQGAPPGERLYRVDPSTSEVVATVPGVSGFGTVLDGDAWLNRCCAALATRVDGQTGAPVRDALVEGGYFFMTSGGGAVWVRANNGDLSQQWILRINPGDASLTRYDLPSPNNLGGLAFGSHSLWVTDGNANALYRRRVGS